MKPRKFTPNHKREIFIESINNLIKSTSGLGLSKDSSKSVKTILEWARDIAVRNNNGKM